MFLFLVKAKTKEWEESNKLWIDSWPCFEHLKFFLQPRQMATTVQEIEEHERKPDTSEKKSVEMNASCSKIQLEEAEEEQEDVGSWIASCKPIKQQLRVHKPSVCIVADVPRARLLAAALDRFLVFGIYTNLAVIKDKVIKTFSLLRAIWTIWEVSRSNDSAFTNLKKYIFWAGLGSDFLSTSFPTPRKFISFLFPVELLLFKKRLGVANLTAVEIIFFLVFRYKNLGELCMHFEPQVGNP